jgi:uncharacterized membrane protein
MMFRLVGPGQLLFAVGLAGLGILSLVFHDFALQWQPVPAGVPGRALLALISGAVLVAGAAALMTSRWSRNAALVLSLYLVLWLLVLRLPQLAVHPLNIATWLGVCENLALLAGARVLYGWLARLDSAGSSGFATSPAAIAGARLALGGACVVFGLSHFAYPDFTAGMIPAWLPARPALAAVTGAAHIAAGTALLLGIAPALAARLEALMLSVIVLLVHVPAVAAKPHDREQWTALCVATALAGAVWIVAGSFRVNLRPATA